MNKNHGTNINLIHNLDHDIQHLIQKLERYYKKLNRSTKLVEFYKSCMVWLIHRFVFYGIFAGYLNYISYIQPENFLDSKNFFLLR